MNPSRLHPQYFILASLAGGQAHGYAIRQAVLDLSDGLVALNPGTLYRLIGGLLDDGLIVESGVRPAAEQDDPRRRYYRLTAIGRRALADETRQLARIVRTVRPVIGGESR